MVERNFLDPQPLRIGPTALLPPVRLFIRQLPTFLAANFGQKFGPNSMTRLYDFTNLFHKAYSFT